MYSGISPLLTGEGWLFLGRVGVFSGRCPAYCLVQGTETVFL
jgi:hypothetical protein